MANKRDYQTGLLVSDDFEDRAGDRLKLARELGSEVKLTLMEIVGLKELAESLPAEETRAPMSDVGAPPPRHSIGGDTAERVDPENSRLMPSKQSNQAAVHNKCDTPLTGHHPTATATR